MSARGIEHGAAVALALTEDGRGAIAWGSAADPATRAVTIDDVVSIEASARPRWVWWSADTPAILVGHGVRPARCWDLVAVHRLLVGGWSSSPGHVWAVAAGLDVATLPVREAPNLFTPPDDAGDPDDPLRPDGHLDLAWIDGEWAASTPHRIDWATRALDVSERHRVRIAAGHDPAHRLRTAHAESAAELLGTELAHDGLPIDLDVAESVIAEFIGPRPRTPGDVAELAAARDAAVLDLVPRAVGSDLDLRSPGQVKSLLRRVGIEVEDTRAWRLERHVDDHPVVEALLRWRRAERIATTFGYDWLDDHVTTIDTATVDGRRRGRLRGRWSASDGAAGRMTATAGLHNMPGELRVAVSAEPGRRLVRADLGQIEPRVLAAISGDGALARATHDDDMYLPVARRLGVDREIAKVAVLGAMYGQTTGRGAEALRGLERAYPVAMGHLREADETAQGGGDLTTYGGRRIRMSGALDAATPDPDVRARAAARGRYGRNAIVQGAAAEFFKTWAALVRARAREFDASIVLCLHDELLVDAPVDASADVATLLDRCLAEAAVRWAPAADPPVRFVADTAIVERWSDAK